MAVAGGCSVVATWSPVTVRVEPVDRAHGFRVFRCGFCGLLGVVIECRWHFSVRGMNT